MKWILPAVALMICFGIAVLGAVLTSALLVAIVVTFSPREVGRRHSGGVLHAWIPSLFPLVNEIERSSMNRGATSLWKYSWSSLPTTR